MCAHESDVNANPGCRRYIHSIFGSSISRVNGGLRSSDALLRVLYDVASRHRPGIGLENLVEMAGVCITSQHSYHWNRRQQWYNHYVVDVPSGIYLRLSVSRLPKSR